jgi:hypothetical protein
MKELTELEQKYQRLGEIFAQARQRYLEAGGDPRRAADNRYLNDDEKKEAFELGAQVFGIQVKDGYAECQGRSWKLGDQQEVKSKESEVSG